MTFTKEQLIKRIEKQIDINSTIIKRLGDDSAAVSELAVKTAMMDMEIFNIALASLTAEPVAWIWKTASGYDTTSVRMPRNRPGKYAARPLYTAPPAPIVPEELLSAMEEVLRISDRDHEAWHKVRNGIASCRAAMLQGADVTLTNEGNKQSDELVMWIKRLAHSLRKANPDSKLQSDAMDYLSRKGLIGVKDILR